MATSSRLECPFHYFALLCRLYGYIIKHQCHDSLQFCRLYLTSELHCSDQTLNFSPEGILGTCKFWAKFLGLFMYVLKRVCYRTSARRRMYYVKKRKDIRNCQGLRHALPSVSCPWDGVSEKSLALLFVGGFINFIICLQLKVVRSGGQVERQL